MSLVICQSWTLSINALKLIQDNHCSCVAKSSPVNYSLPGVGPGADPGVQAVSPRVTFKSFPGDGLPWLSARPAVTFPAEKRHRPSTSEKLYCLVTKPCEHLAQDCYADLSQWELNPRPIDRKSNALPIRHCATLQLHDKRDNAISTE